MIEVDLPNAHVVFTTRQGGVSASPYESLNLGIMTDDADDSVRENRRVLAERIGVPIVMGRQVHGTEIKEWKTPTLDFVHPAFLDEADGHITSASNLAPLVLVADCLPVALAAPGRVAMLHCGWRGLASGIIERALELFDEPPAAAIGPGIGGCCYEVGDEVLAAFVDIPGAAEGRLLDLKAVARHKLGAHVEDVGLCTSCRPDLFFSHRRDRGVTGRQAGLAWLK